MHAQPAHFRVNFRVNYRVTCDLRRCVRVQLAVTGAFLFLCCVNDVSISTA
jgi:hypothetical protein